MLRARPDVGGEEEEAAVGAGFELCLRSLSSLRLAHPVPSFRPSEILSFLHDYPESTPVMLLGFSLPFELVIRP